ncbi:hypothetical protein H5410_001913 [Solanum commersonii]|uniref:Uncharacterized protein n=1 Tax=Solanum commersonii TaxID=4109 RepID=A0A9J6B0J9_SOLCO|nr:hypothetical protein H5410_001913 [Solanum commersonii]
MGWPLSLAGWACEASDPNEAGPNSLIPKGPKKLCPTLLSSRVGLGQLNWSSPFWQLYLR